MPGAKELLDSLKDMGYKIILLSARPYKQYNRIWADTLTWLNSNSLYFDAIIFDRDKEDLVTKLFPNMKYFIDDDESNIKKVSDAGFKCIYVGSFEDFYLFESDENVKCVRTLKEIPRIIT